MSSKGGNQQGNNNNKRKAETQGQQPKKAQPQSGAPSKNSQPQQQQAKKPQQAQPQKKDQPQQKQPKQKAPEPEEDDAEDDDEDDDSEGGEIDEVALAAIDKVQPTMDGIADELEAFDKQMNAEIYAIQKKYLLKKKPILARRDNLFLQTPGIWKALLTNHQVFVSQLDDIDHELLDSLTKVEMDESYTADENEKQQITGINGYFTVSGSTLVKAGRYKKSFQFDDKNETLGCEPVEVKNLPFVNPEKFVKEHPDSFIVNWFQSEGEDDGILAAQDALSSELYVDPLALYTHLSQGGTINQDDLSGDDDDDDAAMMAFGEDGDEESDEDEDAPQLVD